MRVAILTALRVVLSNYLYVPSLLAALCTGNKGRWPAESAGVHRGTHAEVALFPPKG